MSTLFKKPPLEVNLGTRRLGSLETMHAEGLDLSPSYQRELVWTQEDEQSLLESIFIGADIGKFVIIENEYSSKYLFEVLDGKQRISTILKFLENKIAYNNTYFKDMPLKDQLAFKHIPISVAEVRASENASLQKKCQYFLFVNRTGKPIAEDHIKKIEALANNL